MTSPLATGLDVCAAAPPARLRRARLGLLTNQAALDDNLVGAAERVAEVFPGQLQALFGPQHGLFQEQQDNMIETAHARHPRLAVPVHSLYSATRRPTPAMLEPIDVLLVDLPDVGTRVYTYVWTLYECLQACRDADVAVTVLDRPNPIGGVIVEGPLLDPEFSSFVGLRPMPMRHALTLGEAARWLNAEVGAELDVISARGWRRAQQQPDTGRAWIPPSPNLPRFAGAAVYPGQVLLEGTNVSEGRGTTTPFEVCGAPWLDPFALTDDLRCHDLPGVVAQPYRFEPTFHKFAGESCGGVFLHVADPQRFRPYRTTLTLLNAIRQQAPDRFAWRPPGYEYDQVHMPIDLLTGAATARLAMDAGKADPAALSRVDVEAWRHAVADALLYDRNAAFEG